MRTLMVVLFLVLSVEFAGAQVPDDLKLEMTAEQAEYRESKLITPFLAVIILHFPKAKLWVITKIRMVEPKRWVFRDGDIEFITREVDGKRQTLYEKKEGGI